MPIQEFSGDATIRIGQGGTTFALPFSDGRVIAKPKRPDGPAFRELVDGKRKERRADGFYLDVNLEWDELSSGARATLVSLVDGLHTRAPDTKVYFKPVAEPDTSIGYWRVVPALTEGDIDLIYEDRVRAREASLTLKAEDSTPSLPGWLS
jgi:hypothetical protein